MLQQEPERVDIQSFAEDVEFSYGLVVLKRESLYSSWGITIAGGAASHKLPHISLVSGVHELAWTARPLSRVKSL
jgi:hypothetical protein